MRHTIRIQLTAEKAHRALLICALGYEQLCLQHHIDHILLDGCLVASCRLLLGAIWRMKDGGVTLQEVMEGALHIRLAICVQGIAFYKMNR